jgi:rhodanese-related sulfurtransferase
VRHLRYALVAMLACAGCAAGSSFAWVVGIDEIEPSALRARLGQPNPPLVIDVRGDEAYRQGHIAGAVALDPDELPGYFTRLGPSRDRPVVFACFRGFRSVVAAAGIGRLGYREVYSLAGGMERWRAERHPTSAGPPQHLPASITRPPVLLLTGLQEFVEFFAGFVIKPGYVLLTLFLVFVLRRSRRRDVALIRWSLIAFFFGELACYIDIFFGQGRSTVLELFHGLGMVGQNVLLPWGLFVFLDERLLHFTSDDGICAAQRLCGRCWKRDDVPCRLQRMFLFLVPALGALALLPLCAPLRPLAPTMTIYGGTWAPIISLFDMFMEFRVYPALALLALSVTLVLLFFGRAGVRRAQLPFFLGLGLLVFPLFRFFLYEAYRDMTVWADFWEEATEFIATAGVLVFLIVFRRSFGLFGNPLPAEKG